MKQVSVVGKKPIRACAIAAAFVGLMAVACVAVRPTSGTASTTPLVELNKCIPDIVLDIRYATANNFTGKAVYPDARCFLAAEAAAALRDVQEDLKKQGYRLKVFDGYRPLSVQRIFWDILPDPRYVADPQAGSKHNRGYAVDVSLVTRDGGEISMPTEYDDFTERAHPDYAELPADVIAHRAILQEAMARHGFTRFETEWWHFDYQGWEDQPVLDISFDEISGGR